MVRKFIISDIHGLGNVYYSVINYLDNISKDEKIELYINGDLIDRGLESAEILLDIKKRIEENKYKIVYLGGNHELMMHEVFLKRKKEINTNYSDWFFNGGYTTDYGLEEILDDRDKILEVADFISNLKIYHKFSEKIDDKNIILVHAACPINPLDECNLRIKDDNENIFYYVWAREDDSFIPFRCRIGNEEYFTIVGHTPNDNIYGYEYHPFGNYLNIDGGCAKYTSGLFQYDHYPLVEIKNGFLKIMTFNNNNEIIYGNYFADRESIPMNKGELEKERACLNNKLKVKTLKKLDDGIIGY